MCCTNTLSILTQTAMLCSRLLLYIPNTSHASTWASGGSILGTLENSTFLLDENVAINEEQDYIVSLSTARIDTVGTSTLNPGYSTYMDILN